MDKMENGTRVNEAYCVKISNDGTKTLLNEAAESDKCNDKTEKCKKEYGWYQWVPFLFMFQGKKLKLFSNYSSF